MDSTPASNAPPPSPGGRRARSGLWQGLALACALLTLMGAIVIYAFFGPRVTWMTPEDFDHATTRPLPLPPIKQFWKTWITKLTQRHPANPRKLLLNPTLVLLSDNDIDSLKLGAPGYTSTNGAQAWVLSRADGIAFRKRYQQLLAHPVFSQFIYTSDGSLAHYINAESATFGTNRVWAGLTIDIIPKISGGSIRYIAGTRITEFTVPSQRSFGNFSSTNIYDQPPQAAAVLKTNLDIGSRARVPTGGMLVIHSGAKNADGRSYWFMLWVLVTDSKGQPIDP